MENHVKFEEKSRGRTHKRSRSVKDRVNNKSSDNKDLEKVRHKKNSSVTNIQIKMNRSA